MTATERPLSHTFRRLDRQCEAWECASPSSIAIVFVHGWTGDFHETWTWKETRRGLKRLKFWGSRNAKHLVSDFLVHDPGLGADYYSFAHPAGFFDIVGAKKVADALRAFIDLNVVGPRSTWQIVLISHSLGGLVYRFIKTYPFDQPSASSASNAFQR